MKCQFCDKPATVHLTDIVNKQKREIHLCREHAEQQQILKHHELNLSAILQTLIGQHVPLTDELARLTCPACGIKYMEFRADGRLGCPNDYQVFKTELEKLLERIHRSARHVGKSPRNHPGSLQPGEIVRLRQELRQAVESENYEEAARLRDLIRQKEVTG